MNSSVPLAQPNSQHQQRIQRLQQQHQLEQSTQPASQPYTSHHSAYAINLHTPQGQLAALSSLPIFSSHSALPQSLASTAQSSAGAYSFRVPLAAHLSSHSQPPSVLQQHTSSLPVSASPPLLPPFIDQSAGEQLPSSVVAHIQQLRLLSQHLSLDQLAALGVDQQTITTLIALNATHPLPSPLPLTSASSTPSPPPSISSPSPSPSAMSYKSEYSKRHRDGDSSTLHKRSKVDSHATTPSSASDHFSPSPRRRRVIDRSGDEDDRGSDTGSDNDSDGTNSSETADDSPLPSSSNKKRTEEEKARNELQRKRQHQKSDKQRRAKIKDGMEQLKSLVSLHGKLESPDQASIVSASVELVHALRQEISGLKQEVERTRGENAAMKQRGLAGYAGLDAVMRGQLGALGQSPLGQLQLSQLSSLQALNSQLTSLNQQQQQQTSSGGVSQQQLSGLNALNNINMLSSLGLPTNINAAAAHYQPNSNPHHHNSHSQQSSQQQQSTHQGIHSPLPLMPMQSPPPLSMPASHGSNGFTSQFLTHSPPATGIMYGKEWQ